MLAHRRPALDRDPEPCGADQEAGTHHRKCRPFVLPKGRRADGERADDQRVGQEQRVVPRPQSFSLRVY